MDRLRIARRFGYAASALAAAAALVCLERVAHVVPAGAQPAFLAGGGCALELLLVVLLVAKFAASGHRPYVALAGANACAAAFGACAAFSHPAFTAWSLAIAAGVLGASAVERYGRSGIVAASRRPRHLAVAAAGTVGLAVALEAYVAVTGSSAASLVIAICAAGLAVVVLGGLTSALDVALFASLACALAPWLAGFGATEATAPFVLLAAVAPLAVLVRELSSAYTRLAELATTHPITGLPNRRSFEDRFEFALAHAERQITPLCLMYVDVDGLRAYNDTYGRRSGDIALKAIGDALRASLKRGTDLSAHVDGGRFCVLIGAPTENGARTVAERMRRSIAAMKIPNAGTELGVLTVSIGMAYALHATRSTKSEIVAGAERALRAAKRQRSNGIACAVLVPPAPAASSQAESAVTAR